MSKVNNSHLLFIPILLLLSGCGQRQATKQKLSKAKKITKSKSNVHNGDATLLTESNITYNYTPEDFLDENSFQTLILSDNRSYQLNTPNGSRLPEQEIFELEKMALAWNEKDDKIYENLFLSDDKLNQFEQNQKQLELVYFDPKHSELEPSQRETIEHNFKKLENCVKNGKKLLVRGHCDKNESESQFFELSFERAKSVKNELVKMGLEPSMIAIAAVGTSEPIIPDEFKNPDLKIEKNLKNLNCRAEIIAT